MSISITDAELALMRILWRSGSLTAREITEQLEPQKDWHRKTVNTLLSRLEKKGAIRVTDTQGGARSFAANIEKSDYEKKVTTDFVDQLFDGQIAPLLASFAGSRGLDATQVTELKKLLDEIDDDD